MKNYKGLYHDNNIKAPNYEHGAHFKYSELVEALKKLQADLNKDMPNLEINNSPIKVDKILINESPKKHKKIKLKNINNNENLRYNVINTERNDKEIKKEDNDIFIKYSKDTDKELFKRKKNHKKLKLPKELCKSLDRKNTKLPTINSNLNSISLKKHHHKFDETEKVLILDKNIEKYDESEKALIVDKSKKEFEEKEKDKNKKNEENNTIVDEIINRKKNKSKTNRKHYESEIFLPKIKYNYYNQMTIEKDDKDLDNENFENKIQNNDNDNINTIIISPVKKHSHGMLKNILSNEKNINKEELYQNSENKNLNYKLKSIFETERKIRHHHNNHHFPLNSRNKIYNMNKMETTSNEMSKQIFNLKKNLLSNNNRNLKIAE